jgi:hypothetical protein
MARAGIRIVSPRDIETMVGRETAGARDGQAPAAVAEVKRQEP